MAHSSVATSSWTRSVSPFQDPASPPLVVPPGNEATPPGSRAAECPILGCEAATDRGQERESHHPSRIWSRSFVTTCQSSAWMSSESEGTRTTGGSTGSASFPGSSARSDWYTLGASQPACPAFLSSSCLRNFRRRQGSTSPLLSFLISSSWSGSWGHGTCRTRSWSRDAGISTHPGM